MQGKLTASISTRRPRYALASLLLLADSIVLCGGLAPAIEIGLYALIETG